MQSSFHHISYTLKESFFRTLSKSYPRAICTPFSGTSLEPRKISPESEISRNLPPLLYHRRSASEAEIKRPLVLHKEEEEEEEVLCVSLHSFVVPNAFNFPGRKEKALT